MSHPGQALPIGFTPASMIDTIINIDDKAALDEAFGGIPIDIKMLLQQQEDEGMVQFWSEDGNRHLLENHAADMIAPVYLYCYSCLAKLFTAHEDDIKWKLDLDASSKLYALLLDRRWMGNAYPAVDFGEAFASAECHASRMFFPVMRAYLTLERHQGPVAILRWLQKTKPEGVDEIIERHRRPWDTSDGQGKRIGYCSYEDIFLLRVLPDQDIMKTLAWLAREESVPLKDVRFSLLSGRRLFISETKNKTIDDLGLRDGEIIIRDTIRTEDGQDPTQPQPDADRSGSGNAEGANANGGSRSRRPAAKQRQKKKKGNSHPINVPTKMSSDRIQHSKKMSLVFEEADSTLKRIRRKLNELSLKRTPPKRSSAAAATSGKDSSATNHPAAFDPDRPATGKAGKVFFDVKVGEATCLYKSNKPSQRRRGGRRRSRRDETAPAVVIDLHGCTKEEGRARLDSALPGWLRMAMEGSSPWVIRVRIVCGGGNQFLAETVEEWIRRNDSVAKAFGK